MNEYSITLSFNSGTEAIEFPVLPEKIEVAQAGDSKTYDISALGEISLFKSQNLREISLESFFPVSWFPGVNVSERELFEPKYYIEKMQGWRTKKQPMLLVMTGSSIDIYMLVSIEKITWSEQGGSVGDIHFQISLKEYREYGVKKLQTQKSSNGGETVVLNKSNSTPRPDTRVIPKTYTLIAGDNLWKVAQKHLGDGAKFKQIQTLNGIRDSELKKLPIGRVIKLP
ncbi:LysM repeat protein [Paenibacillus anaericanus]|uniref:LysM peptidoglycan-binding domain-containing protein n=1 Tax=Paenibacillus anaericanus TaxID=170367 RepID=UPI00278122E9|nr:LysM peptidoglycan-binding domain-containing protein [Paenibacillus anaericanus]MDQ0090187.1 LysM repeat protein [Paenibacillus anaericanus]